MIDVIKESALDQFLTCKAIANIMQYGLIKVGKEVYDEEKPEIDETEELVRMLAGIYKHNFKIIQESLTEKMGDKGEKIFTETFQSHKSEYPLLADYLTGKHGEMGFELMLKLAKSLPNETRVHRIIANFNDLLADYLDTLQKYLGKKSYKRTVSQLKINTQNNINSRKQLALKWGLEEEFSRALRSIE
jgi:hypothetical protein